MPALAATESLIIEHCSLTIDHWQNQNISLDAFAKSQKRSFPVIPANPGSGSGTGAGIQCFNSLRILWTPFFNGVTTFYEIINLKSVVFNVQ